MRIEYAIHATIHGTLDEVQTTIITPAPTLEDVVRTMGELAFVVETIAHLQGKEAQLLPTANRARDLIDMLRPRTIAS